MAIIRMATVGVPRFAHDGLEVTQAWQEYDLDKVPPDTKVAALEQMGTLVQVHPDDKAKFDEDLKRWGLEYQVEPDGRRKIRTIDKAQLQGIGETTARVAEGSVDTVEGETPRDLKATPPPTPQPGQTRARKP